jgi:hypothetical protein
LDFWRWWYNPDKGTVFVHFMIVSGVCFSIYWFQSKKFSESKSKYPLETVGNAELFQANPNHIITCGATEYPYSAKYSVGPQTYLITLGCADKSKLRSGQQIDIWYSRENPQLAIWADSDHQAPSSGWFVGSVFAFFLGVLTLIKGDRIFPGSSNSNGNS